jgi:hypothetical protein
MSYDDFDDFDDEEQRQRWDMAHGDAGPLPEEWSRETSPPGHFDSDWDPGLRQREREKDEQDAVGDDAQEEQNAN